eukprot:superscaffoldBa00012063_g25505
MLKSLNVLEESAVQLDRMNKGSKISSVAGSSVGVIAGIFAIVGAALSPVTAGASLALSMTGLGLGVTRGVNKIITKVTEIGVNCTYQKKANEALKSFMKDVKSIQGCLGEVSSQTVTDIEVSEEDVATGAGKVLLTVGGVGKGIKSLADDDISDGGQAIVNGSLEVPSSIMLSSLFIGMDIFTICKDSVSLAKGRETEVSQFIRARAALWRSEMDSWKKIRDSLHQGLLTSEEK